MTKNCGRGELRPFLSQASRVLRVLAITLAALFIFYDFAFAAQKVKINIPSVIYLPNSDGACKLGDIAKLDGPRKAVGSLAGLILSLDPAVSKKTGKVRTLTQDQVLRAIQTSGLDDLQIELRMPKTVRIEYPAAVGNGTVVPVDTESAGASGANDLNFMVKSLAAWDGDVEVTANATIPPGQLIKPASIVPGYGAATLQFKDDRGRVRSLAIRMVWTQDVIMAARPIARNKAIRREDLMVRKMRITKAGQYATQMAQVIGCVSRKEFDQGAPVELAMLTSAAMLKKGRNVQIIAKIGGLLVQADGTLLEDGAVGDIVKVRRVGAAYKKTELRARIVNENTVEIEVN